MEKKYSKNKIKKEIYWFIISYVQALECFLQHLVNAVKAMELIKMPSVC